MIKERLRILKNNFSKFGIDGYIVPKNDEFFSEYANIDRLKIISNFSGSAGYAIILKTKNYLFVDGRYTIQAKLESEKYFKVIDYHKIINCNLFSNKTLGLDPRLFTSQQIKRFFLKNNKIKEIQFNLVDNIYQKPISKFKPFFSISADIVGEDYKRKIDKLIKF